jgi:Fe-S-cluster containining protein
MLFERCAQCQRCCHVDPGYPALEVSLTQAETQQHGRICIETSCTHLGPEGCQLGDGKPLSCKLYPLSFEPESRTFHFDVDCPLKTLYFAQLSDPSSQASQHLVQMADAIRQLEHTDSPFLQDNFAIDSAYFELEALPTNPLLSPVSS